MPETRTSPSPNHLRRLGIGESCHGFSTSPEGFILIWSERDASDQIPLARVYGRKVQQRPEAGGGSAVRVSDKACRRGIGQVQDRRGTADGGGTVADAGD